MPSDCSASRPLPLPEALTPEATGHFAGDVGAGVEIEMKTDQLGRSMGTGDWPVRTDEGMKNEDQRVSRIPRG
jgi:hypothetical protein